MVRHDRNQEVSQQALPPCKQGPFQAVQTLRKERNGQVAGHRGWAPSCRMEGWLETRKPGAGEWMSGEFRSGSEMVQVG